MSKNYLLSIAVMVASCGSTVDLAAPLQAADAVVQQGAAARNAYTAQAAPLGGDVAAPAGAAVQAYVDAILHRDARAVRVLLSQEVLERLAARVPGADLDAKLERFVERERRKLIREFGTAAAPERGAAARTVTLRATKSLNGGQVVAANLAINGQDVPKPLYLVRESGGLRINVRPPSGVADADTESNYRVKNADGVSHDFYCDVGFNYTIAPRADRSFKCTDTCEWGPFRGTYFEMAGEVVGCDYNTFGIDMTIRHGIPDCNDPCDSW